MQLWFNSQRPKSSLSSQENGNLIILSESSYQKINEHQIPVERHAIAATANAPGVLDSYVRIAWKSWATSGRVAF